MSVPIPEVPPVGGPAAPPYANPLPGLDNFTLPRAVQEGFVHDLMEGMRSEMESWAHATGEMETNLSSVVDAARMLKDEAHASVMEIRNLRLDEDSQRTAIIQMEEMGLTPEVIAAAVRLLSTQAETGDSRPQSTAKRAGITDEVAAGVVQGIEQSREDTEVGTTAKAAPAESAASRRAKGDPFSDAIDSGRLPAGGGLPDTGGLPAGRAPRSTADEGPMMTWDEGVRLGGDFGSLRERAAGGINKWASERLERQRPARLPDGGWERPRAGARFERQENSAGRLMGAVDAIGDGAGVAGALGALSTSLARVLGPLGIAAGAFQMGGNFLGSQRADNMAYQNVFGGGQVDAYGQRLQETMFSRFDAFGTLSAGEGARLFRNVSQLGMEGEERQRATGFALDLYREGVTLDTSMRLIKVASEEGEGALEEYANDLRDLSETAKESGVAIKEAHRLYVEAVEGASQITTGEDASALAHTVANIQTQQQNTGLGEIDYMSMVQDQRQVRRAAAAEGISYGEMSSRLIQGDHAAVSAVINTGVEGLMTYLRRNTITPEAEGEIQGIFDRAGGVLDAESATAIAGILLEQRVYDHETISQLAANFGLPRLNPVQLDQMIARAWVGDQSMNISEMTEEGAESREERALTTWDNGDPLRPGGLNLQGGNQKVAHRAREEWGWDPGSELLGQDFWMGGATNNFDAENVVASSDEYFRQIFDHERDERSRALEDVYSYIGRQGEDDTEEDMQARAEEFNTATFRVLDEKGDVAEEFGIADMANYTKELETGRVQMVGSDGKAKPLSQVVGSENMSVDPDEGVKETIRLTDALEILTAQLTAEGINVNVEAKGDLADMLSIYRDGGAGVKGDKNMGRVSSGYFQGLSNPFFDGSGGN